MTGRGNVAEFDMLMEPQTSRTNGKIYHFVQLRLEGVGTGQVFVTKEQYDSMRAAGLKRGDMLQVLTSLRLWQGKLEPSIVGFERVA